MKKRWWLFVIIAVVLFVLFVLLKKNISFMKEEIPKQIFLTFKFDLNNLPQKIKDNIENTKSLNPGYEIRYYSDSDAEKFINENFPEYMDDYNTLIPGAYKADLLRLLLLYKYGGVYNDIGHVYLEPISKIIFQNDTLLVCKDQVLQGLPSFYLHNALIASSPNHQMIKKAIDVIIENVRNKFYGNSALEPTGPGAFGKAFNLYFERKEDEPINIGMFNKETKVLNHPGHFIEDTDGLKIIKTKFDNYYETVYPEGRDKTYYSVFWDKREIYLP